MADFVIRPAGDPDWGNARFLSGTLPLGAVDAAALGIAMGTDYEIGRLGAVTTFRVSDVPAAMAAPSLLAGTDQLEVTLPAAPTDNGQPITGNDLRYRIGSGAWTENLGITSPYIITGLTTGVTVEVQVRATNANGAGPWSTSGSATVSAGLSAPEISGLPTLAGVAQVDAVLTATPAAVTANPAATRTWQWQRDGVSISGATSASYTINIADEGAVLTVRQTETNSEGTDIALSAATSAIIAADDTTPPLINASSFDGTTITEDLTEASGAATVAWATADVGANPTFTITGGWSGTVYETGTYSVVEGANSNTISLTSTTPEGNRALIRYLYDAAGNLTDPDVLAFTAPAASTSSLIDFSALDAADWTTNSRFAVSNSPAKFALAVTTGGLARGAVRVDTLHTFDANETYRFTFPLSAPTTQTLSLNAGGNSAMSASPSLTGTEASVGPGGVSLTIDVPGSDLLAEFWVGIRIETPGPNQNQTLTLDAAAATVEQL